MGSMWVRFKIGRFHSVWKMMILLWGLLLLPQKAYGFDTGHHFDLTGETLQKEGFQNTAIEVTQVENWLTDYYSNSPTSSMKSELAKLHFDNLFTTEQIRNYWGHLTVNTRNAVHEATREKDALKILTILGVSLHAVQDFYTHSNWVDTHPTTSSTDSFQTKTWFNSPPPDLNLITGLATSTFSGTKPPNFSCDIGYDSDPNRVSCHGGYKTGRNKDSYVRPHWDEAYVFAYVGSREWINAVHSWVNEVDPGFWSSVQNFYVSGADRLALNSDLKAVYRLSEWINQDGEDGHWKGNGSGSNDFLPFAVSWTSSSDSRFVKQFKDQHTYRLLLPGLTGNGSMVSPPPTPIPTVPKIALNERAIIVRTLKVAEKDDVGLFEQKIDPLGKADFYAKINVAGQNFTEAMQLDKSSISPAWTTIKFVPATTSQVPILYELWDEDGGLRGDDDRVDINPAANKQNLNFNFDIPSHNLTGDITGVHDSSATAVTSEGKKPDSDRAIIQFSVTERALSVNGEPSTEPNTKPGTETNPQPHQNGVRYNAVWRQSSDPEIQVYGWSYDDYRAKYDELWNQNWRLHVLQAYVVDGKVLYNAVWRQSSDPEIQVYGWSYDDYRAKYDELWNQNWRLHILQPYL